MKYLLGVDVGSSSVKTALIEITTGRIAATAFSPSEEMQIDAPQSGFAEQDPDRWWQEMQHALNKVRQQVPFKSDEVAAIGISYQMHGLVCVDKAGKPLRPSIIWCDGRAVTYGNKAFHDLGEDFCLSNFLNSPGNFTASKLKWVRENQPDIYKQIHKIMLPGDYIALRLTGDATTTVSGLSEGILWNFKQRSIAKDLLNYYGIDESLLSAIVPTFGEQGRLTAEAAATLQLKAGIPVSYRAGDQPNNAYSLNVLQPGEVAATAGTSGVVYGVTDKVEYDPKSRVNTFVHVTHTEQQPRYGILLCVNGTGILNSWLRKNSFGNASYADMNAEAAAIAPGADGLQFFPFGNGAERVLENKDPGGQLQGLQFNRHHRGHVARAAQEGIVFSLQYGMEIMQQMGMQMKTIRAGHANMFLSDVFGAVFANTTGCTVELYNTDGAAGAARAAGVGAGIYPDFKSCFAGMNVIKRLEPTAQLQEQYKNVYGEWKTALLKSL
ncbi:FGGY family carbohydrate kinase [Paraflavitalea sp. CAU 1676]|uniref:xylulokinase n=1 Tax=Paraflavitalea sp. CAU 1676 TaxID=3032598 RepID=UPI0023DC74C6|nr:FGGY family carbohydrate kinase [Paraflavitalea sp. CAU 1676]MDF2189959.1 FGGY family carbohydrate kinase [Paraflavitalea sp. CAU 1676]